MVNTNSEYMRYFAEVGEKLDILEKQEESDLLKWVSQSITEDKIIAHQRLMGSWPLRYVWRVNKIILPP